MPTAELIQHNNIVSRSIAYYGFTLVVIIVTGLTSIVDSVVHNSVIMRPLTFHSSITVR